MWKKRGIVDAVDEHRRFNIFVPFRNLYHDIRDDEEKKKKSVFFGLFAILFSAISVGIVYPGVYWGIKSLGYAFTHYFGIGTWFFGLANIFFICLGVAGFCLPYYFWIQSVILLVWQFLLNRRFISWFALIIWLASLVGIIWLTVISLDLIVNPMLEEASSNLTVMLL